MEIIIIILFLIYLLKKFNSSRDSSSKPWRPINGAPAPDPGPEATSPQYDYSNSYKRKYLFSRNEKNELRNLLEWASSHNYFVFPKVRFLDIIEPRDHHDKSLLWKIQAKHVDFLVCDHDFRILFIIELDDNSHDRKDRSDRDEFVRQALSGAGYTLLHTRGISDEFLSSLKFDKQQ